LGIRRWRSAIASTVGRLRILRYRCRVRADCATHLPGFPEYQNDEPTGAVDTRRHPLSTFCFHGDHVVRIGSCGFGEDSLRDFVDPTDAGRHSVFTRLTRKSSCRTKVQCSGLFLRVDGVEFGSEYSNEIGSAEIRRLIVDLQDTLQCADGIGLAAPQIDEPVRVAIIDIPGGPSRYGMLEPMPFTVFVNPNVEVLDPAAQGCWEGCLSIPGLRGFVERPQHVKVVFTNLRGESEELDFSGFHATVVQHELDHLDGKLFVDRITDFSKLAFEDEYKRYVAKPRMPGAD